MTSGNMTVLFNGKENIKSSIRDVDLDLEKLKLKVCLRKEIPYEELKLEEAEKKKEFSRMNFNEKKRLKLIKEIRTHHPGIVTLIKNNAKLLNTWVCYVVK